eukprot:scaffold25310_cov54-Isochrysis_galbana.AAC.1
MPNQAAHSLRRCRQPRHYRHRSARGDEQRPSGGAVPPPRYAPQRQCRDWPHPAPGQSKRRAGIPPRWIRAPPALKGAGGEEEAHAQHAVAVLVAEAAGAVEEAAGQVARAAGAGVCAAKAVAEATVACPSVAAVQAGAAGAAGAVSVATPCFVTGWGSPPPCLFWDCSPLWPLVASSGAGVAWGKAMTASSSPPAAPCTAGCECGCEDCVCDCSCEESGCEGPSCLSMPAPVPAPPPPGNMPPPA